MITNTICRKKCLKLVYWLEIKSNLVKHKFLLIVTFIVAFYVLATLSTISIEYKLLGGKHWESNYIPVIQDLKVGTAEKGLLKNMLLIK